jgi:micrococcal nuclease
LSPHRPERLLAILAVLAVTASLVVILVLLTAGAPDLDPSASASRGAIERALVARVVDGDTVIVTRGGREERVRYIGVDAPELASSESGAPAECGAVAAAEANRALVEGMAVELERDVSDRDRFGRLLRHAWIVADGERALVAALLARTGAVEARSYPPDTRHDERLDAAESLARSEAAGIWGSC